MLYEKPKVTIDLDEYNELIKLKEAASSDETLLMAKQVVATIVNNRGDLPKSVEHLKYQKIKIVVINSGTSVDGIGAENIIIEKIKP